MASLVTNLIPKQTVRIPANYVFSLTSGVGTKRKGIIGADQGSGYSRPGKVTPPHGYQDNLAHSNTPDKTQ